jgi:membrane-associated phospholipid phosphatase
MLTPLEWYLISAVIAGGLVLSSRLKLNLHSPLQVWMGLVTGFLGLTLFMILF